MLELIQSHPVAFAAMLCCQIIVLLEMVMFFTFNRAYYRLGRPMSDLVLPRMPLRATAGRYGIVTWKGDAQVIRFRRRLELVGRRAYGYGQLTREADGTIRATWAPFPNFSMFVMWVMMGIFLGSFIDWSTEQPWPVLLILVLFPLAILVNFWLSWRAGASVLQDLSQGLDDLDAE